MSAPPDLPSNRSFGSTFAVFFALVGLWSWWRGGGLWPWFLVLAAATLLIVLTAPGVLSPLNKSWMRLGDHLNRIVSPLVLGIIYFGLLTPIGFVMRLAGRDALNRRFEPGSKSYWVEREPPGPDPESLPNQF